jgi:tripartite-type tricarboxylate transporter receptor subunit TctC
MTRNATKTVAPTRRTVLATAAGLFGLLLASGPAQAQAWPAAKPIRLIVGFAPGGAAD